MHELGLGLRAQTQRERELLEGGELRGEDLAALEPADRPDADPGGRAQLALGLSAPKVAAVRPATPQVTSRLPPDCRSIGLAGA